MLLFLLHVSHKTLHSARSPAWHDSLRTSAFSGPPTKVCPDSHHLVVLGSEPFATTCLGPFLVSSFGISTSFFPSSSSHSLDNITFLFSKYLSGTFQVLELQRGAGRLASAYMECLSWLGWGVGSGNKQQTRKHINKNISEYNKLGGK